MKLHVKFHGNFDNHETSYRELYQKFQWNFDWNWIKISMNFNKIFKQLKQKLHFTNAFVPVPFTRVLFIPKYSLVNHIEFSGSEFIFPFSSLWIWICAGIYTSSLLQLYGRNQLNLVLSQHYHCLLEFRFFFCWYIFHFNAQYSLLDTEI